MLRVAIVEKEEMAKNIIFSLSKILDDEFCFVHFDKISEFVRKQEKAAYDIIVLNESYNNVRVTEALNYQKNNVIIIYCGSENALKEYNPYTRIFEINSNMYKEDLLHLKPYLDERLNKHREYLFSYNGVVIRMKYHDIYYIEKEDKDLVYYTKKGEFRERGSIAKKSEEMQKYDFIRINSGILVNYEYIYQVNGDDVEMNNHVILPISRSRKAYVTQFIKSKAGK